MIQGKRGWLRLLVLLWWGAIALGCQGYPSGSPFAQIPDAIPGQSAKVVRVVSGHTIEVQPIEATDANNQTVRLIGIEAPAQGQDPWDREAKRHLTDLVLGQTVTLEPDEVSRDAYDRSLAYVWLGDQLVNQTLVAEGLVLAGARSPNLKHQAQLQEAQSRARLLGLGIWNPDQPMTQTPQEFRAAAPS